MSSGIAINPKCISEFQGVVDRKYFGVILRIGDDKKELIVDKSIENNASADPETKWADVIKSLPENDCRFLLCDFQWKVSAASTSSKLCCIHWAPEYSSPVSKMIYATTLDSLNNKVNTQRTVQATEKDEIDYTTIKAALAK